MTDVAPVKTTEVDPWFLLGSLGMRLQLAGQITIDDWNSAVADAAKWRAAVAA